LHTESTVNLPDAAQHDFSHSSALCMMRRPYVAGILHAVERERERERVLEHTHVHTHTHRITHQISKWYGRQGPIKLQLGRLPWKKTQYIVFGDADAEDGVVW